MLPMLFLFRDALAKTGTDKHSIHLEIVILVNFQHVSQLNCALAIGMA